MPASTDDQPPARNMMEEVLNASDLGDPKSDWASDWAYAAQKRVWEGSDGLWMRIGPERPKQEWDSDKCLDIKTCGSELPSRLFSLNFNPCVSGFSVLLLTGLVVFCMVPPGKFCSRAVHTYHYEVDGTHFTARKIFPQPSNLLPGEQRLTVDGSSYKFTLNTSASPLTALITHNNDVHNATVTIKQRLEDYDCFMPLIEFNDWAAWITDNFTWFYIITQDVWIIFVVYLCCSKYGTEKLGRREDEPDFNYFEWFSMLFTCGVATGLFYFAVSEPQYHYLVSEDNPGGYSDRTRWTYAGVYESNGVVRTPNQRAQDAMTAVWYHWGLHGWVCYCILGLLLAFLHYRKGLPMTIKTCLYPLLGESIYGFVGDLLDTISVVSTTMGVCTSLGLGVMQLNTGIELLNGDQHWMGLGYYNENNKNLWDSNQADLKSMWDSWDAASKTTYPWYEDDGQAAKISTVAHVARIDAQTNQQTVLIWIITAVASTSVMFGLRSGIKNLAIICMVLGQFIISYVWMMDDTWFLTDFFVQTLGHYVGSLPVLGFYTSAFEKTETNNAFGEYKSWQTSWTIFYWGWWIAWAPFVGVFLARLGKGRTVREFIIVTLFAAVTYNVIFMTVLGGSSLKMQMLAEKHNIGSGCNDDTLGSDFYRRKAYKKNVCREISRRKYSGEKEYFCSTITNLACTLKKESGDRALFDVVSQYADVGRGMIIVTLVVIALYFVASSDSGSMVDDIVTANGCTEPCLTQRLFWSLVEGGAATALVSVGKHVGDPGGALKALRACSICVGLPYTVIICLMCVSLYRALQYEREEIKWTDGFQEQIFDVGISLYKCTPSRYPKVEKDKIPWSNYKKGRCKRRKVGYTALYTVCPFYPIITIRRKIKERKEEKKQESLSGSKPSLGGLAALTTPAIRKKTRLQEFMGSDPCYRIAAVVVVLLLYISMSLHFIDQTPLSSVPQEWGSVQGDEKEITQNTRYKLTNRWGYFHEWANKDSERNADDEITWNTAVLEDAQEVPLQAIVDGTSVGEVGVGERMAYNYRIAGIGWFLLIGFIIYITFLRSMTRAVLPNPIPGNVVEDFMVCCLWPLALRQMEIEFEKNTEKAKDDDGFSIQKVKIDFL